MRTTKERRCGVMGKREMEIKDKEKSRREEKEVEKEGYTREGAGKRRIRKGRRKNVH